MTGADVLALLPFLLAAAGAILIALASAVVRVDDRAWALIGALIAASGALAAAVLGGGASGVGGAVVRDEASTFVDVVVLASASTGLVFALDRAHRQIALGGTTAIVLATAAGATLLAAAADLRILLIGLVLVAVPAQLASSARAARRTDAGTVARSALAPFLVALGIVLVYLTQGSFALGTLADLGGASGAAGVALITAGLAFAAAIVPLRTSARIAPAVAQTGMSVAAIAGTSGALLRIAGAVTASEVAALDWRASLAVVAALALVLANVLALAESSLRRLIAYGAVAQAGLVAVALASGATASASAVFALAILALVTVGLLALVSQLGRDPHRVGLGGLARRRPVFAAALAVLLLALAGLPPTGGFIARAFVFEAAIGARLAWLVILAAFSGVASAAWSLRVLFACLGDVGPDRPRGGRIATGVAIVAAVVVLLAGVVPGPLLDAAANVRF